jgi:UDP-N-acetylglucosamine transferase subunit ALG13
MILVITGTEVHPFVRLIDEVDRLAKAGTLGEPLFVQLGHNKQPPAHCEWRRFVPFGEICRLIEESKAVVTHAGAGSTLVCIQGGKRPIIVPRQKRFGEHVDDHQLEFARRLKGFDLVRLVQEMGELEGALREQLADSASSKQLPEPAQLISHLEGLLERWEREPRA